MFQFIVFFYLWCSVRALKDSVQVAFSQEVCALTDATSPSTPDPPYISSKTKSNLVLKWTVSCYTYNDLRSSLRWAVYKRTFQTYVWHYPNIRWTLSKHIRFPRLIMFADNTDKFWDFKLQVFSYIYFVRQIQALIPTLLFNMQITLSCVSKTCRLRPKTCHFLSPKHNNEAEKTYVLALNVTSWNNKRVFLNHSPQAWTQSVIML